VKSVAAAMIAAVWFAPAAHAARPAENPACLAPAHGMVRVADDDVASGNALRPELDQPPCPQFLSTSVVARQARAERT